MFWKVNYFETEKRAPLTKLLPGDNFLANRGFDISESVKTFVFGSVNPAFTKGTGQLYFSWNKANKKSTHDCVRIKVEIVQNKYTILQKT